MGGSAYSEKFYAVRTANLAATNSSPFEHDEKIRKGETVASVHEKMNPRGVKFRESCDSPTHPDSHAVVIMFDVTGSMGGIPVRLQQKLSGLMALLIKKGYLLHPAICISAVGDATSDQAPLQVGQFESGNEIDLDLAKIWLEGKGGGSAQESYELGMYFFANHVKMDCLDKRNKKGYLFIIGDERPYPRVSASQVRHIIGDTPQADIPVAEIAAQLKEKFEVFVLIPVGAAHSGDSSIRKDWTDLFGQNVFVLDNPDAVSEVIATTIGLHEGKTDLNASAKDLEDVGSGDVVGTVTTALSGYKKVGGSDTGGGSATAVADDDEPGDVERL